MFPVLHLTYVPKGLCRCFYECEKLFWHLSKGDVGNYSLHERERSRMLFERGSFGRSSAARTSYGATFTPESVGFKQF